MKTLEELSTEGLFACRDGLTARNWADKNYMYLLFKGITDGGEPIELIISTYDLKNNRALTNAFEAMLDAAKL